jgi:nitrous oxidase accessory protein NosD
MKNGTRGIGALAAAAAFAAILAAAAPARSSNGLFAAPQGAGSACTAKHPCRLDAAIAEASAGATVHVAKGKYAGGYVIDKKMHLVADGRVVLDASSSPNGIGIDVVGPGGDGSVIQGFIVEKATFEGILVGTSPSDPNPAPAPVSDVTLRNNIVVMNNQGRGKPGATGECKSTPPAPADCGGGIHLIWATDSVVENNIVAYNSDGILLTDEFGPTAHNIVRNNKTLNNLYECGIVLAGHNPNGADPTKAGVFDNVIENNLARNNGVKTTGAGILLGGGAPGSAVYDNTIRNNTVDMNGHAGITIHQHVTGNLTGNVIENNTVGTNNSLGDDDFAAAVDMQTTGILVASGSPPGPALPPFLLPSPLSGTVITGNKISGDAIGIWTLNTPGDLSNNTFGSDVATPVSSH